MLGFLKKFKKSKDDDKPKPDDATPAAGAETEEGTSEQGKKKKKFSIKMILIILVVLVILGGGGFAGYTFFLAPKSSDDQAPVYQKVELKYLQLPDEMLKFSFDYLPELYAAMLVYDQEMAILDSEIERIEAIGKQYPDQQKIADKEKKIWEKTKAGLEKTFLKIQKPVKEVYVLFRVNPEQGNLKIEEKHPELAALATEALKPAQEMTQKLKTEEAIPDGMIDKTLYKLKKKFL